MTPKTNDVDSLMLEFEHRVIRLLMTNSALTLNDSDENARHHQEEWRQLTVWFSELLQKEAPLNNLT